MDYNYYFWDFSDIHNMKEFNSFVNCGKMFDNFRGIEKMCTYTEKLRFSAIVKKFSNDK